MWPADHLVSLNFRLCIVSSMFCFTQGLEPGTLHVWLHPPGKELLGDQRCSCVTADRDSFLQQKSASLLPRQLWRQHRESNRRSLEESGEINTNGRKKWGKTPSDPTVKISQARLNTRSPQRLIKQVWKITVIIEVIVLFQCTAILNKKPFTDLFRATMK